MRLRKQGVLFAIHLDDAGAVSVARSIALPSGLA
jgi:hypothetical protein